MNRAGRGPAGDAVRDSLRTQLWPLPALGVVLAVATGVTLPRLDARVQEDFPAWLADYLFGGGAGAARTSLDAIAGSLITVTALTFSLTVVTLQLASSQFSPRLLRTFTSDRFVQGTLAVFLATFTYALTVLRTVRTADAGQAEFVPRLSVTLAFVLALASVLTLVLFLSHLAREIRVETMLAGVHADAERTLRQLLPDTARREGAKAPPLPSVPGHALLLTVDSSGFLTGVDENVLLAAAVGADAVLLIDRQPGTSLIAGTPVGAAWPRTSTSFGPDTEAGLRRQFRRAISTGPERTGTQDIAFGLRQLADVAAKALSAGFNDPTTAIHALSHSSALLCDMAEREPGPRLLYDDHRLRVVLDRPDLGDLLDLALTQPCRYGATDAAVLDRLLTLLRELAWHASPSQHPPIAHQLARLRATVAAQDFHPGEHARLTALAGQVEQAMAGVWVPVTDSGR
ncbi:DUF2254 domain-containing protein [Streptomyces sp. NBC_01216]|uniref:DUF2254 domain-containing protein n=1 Tax=Streptomyces sp. NBC_01216 TaxID=2903778 RepID=UPI002E0FCE34|nr:DUF2254 domain-containing protein [Streptomyces sp. NBC_01216]